MPNNTKQKKMEEYLQESKQRSTFAPCDRNEGL